MKKRAALCLSLVLLFCLLLSGFTRIERKTPSARHGSRDTQFGTFTVPLPDYYEKNDKYYVCCEKSNSVTALIQIACIDGESTDGFEKLNGVTFYLVKDALLDKLIETFTEDAERIFTEDITVAGLPAATADYTRGDVIFRAAAVYDEEGKQLLCLVCIVSGSASYDGYFDDFSDMLGNVTLAVAGTAPAEETGTGGVTPEVKEFWDSYEAFVDEYIDFMQRYMKNPYDFSLLGKISTYMSKLTDLEEKADKFTDSSRYSGEDLAYSLEVYARIMKKLASVL